jgi:hypothetical protein
MDVNGALKTFPPSAPHDNVIYAWLWTMVVKGTQGPVLPAENFRHRDWVSKGLLTITCAHFERNYCE